MSAFKGAATMSEVDKFKFDLQGYIIVRGVLSAEEVAAANAAVDAHSADFCERVGATLRNTGEGSALGGAEGASGRRDLGGMLEWAEPAHTAPFRSILAHPKLLPYYHALLGEGYRMDHLPLLLSQRAGTEGFDLHGGPIAADGGPNHHLNYVYSRGTIRTSLLAVSLQLTDAEPGAGGFVALPGSHKGNYPVPPSLLQGGADAEEAAMLLQPATAAGDVVLFTEALVHGTRPWAAAHERRTCIYRFAPANVAYGRSYHPDWPPAMLAGLSGEQRAVLEPPYNNRLDRPELSFGGESELLITKQSRSPEKKAFDRAVFHSPYF